MYKSADAKKAYFKERYNNNKERYKKANEQHWIKVTREKLGKEDVTEEEVKQVRNEYYKEYRRTHKAEIQKHTEDFWKRKVLEHKESEE